VTARKKQTYAFDPDWTIHPGEILKEELVERAKGISFPTWARILHLTPEQLEGIFAGTEPITEDIAQRIAHGLGTGAQIWLNLERAFRSGLAAGKTWITDPAKEVPDA
jgi:addiction module HigA family antidote